MAWPTNKPDSNKFSADTNSIKESRPELNTMSDAVNNIVDFIDTADIGNNKILKYNSTSGALEFVAESAGAVTNPLNANLNVNNFTIQGATSDSAGVIDGAVTLDGAEIRIQRSDPNDSAGSGVPTVKLMSNDALIRTEGGENSIRFIDASKTVRLSSPNQTVDFITAGIDIGNTSSVPRINSSQANAGIILSSDTTNRGQIAIIGGSNGNIEVAPNGSGKILFGNGSNQAVITTSASSAQNLKLETANGINSGTMLINQGANGDIEITPNGTGKTKIDNLEYNEPVHTLTYGANITPEPSDGAIQEILLTGNVNFQGFATETNGSTVTLIIKQDGTGNRTFSEGLDSAGRMLFAGGTQTLSTGANAIDIMTISFVGGIYYASLSTNFS
tara:strand:- start:473 stop:1639 length:1167 start_codon:yes stop_codon:yes gene_type:complete